MSITGNELVEKLNAKFGSLFATGGDGNLVFLSGIDEVMDCFMQGKIVIGFDLFPEEDGIGFSAQHAFRLRDKHILDIYTFENDDMGRLRLEFLVSQNFHPTNVEHYLKNITLCDYDGFCLPNSAFDTSTVI